MNYQEFIETIKDRMKAEVPPEFRVTLQPILKNNGTSYDGLIIIDPILNISPTIYLNPYYHRYLNGVSMEDIFDDILKTYQENLPSEDFDISVFKDFAKASGRIIMKLVNTERNQLLLKDVPSVPFYDLSIIFMCSVSDYLDEYATILIHNQHLTLWGITTEELYQIAMKNTPFLLKYNFDKMEKILEHLIDKPLPFVSDLDMYLLTNELRIHGATCLVYPKLLQKISNRLEDNLIIIPSSIHEVLIIPEKTSLESYNLEDYRALIEEVNETQLTDDEVLSDHAYLYHKDTGAITY